MTGEFAGEGQVAEIARSRVARSREIADEIADRHRIPWAIGRRNRKSRHGVAPRRVAPRGRVAGAPMQNAAERGQASILRGVRPAPASRPQSMAEVLRHRQGIREIGAVVAASKQGTGGGPPDRRGRRPARWPVGRRSHRSRGDRGQASISGWRRAAQLVAIWRLERDHQARFVSDGPGYSDRASRGWGDAVSRSRGGCGPRASRPPRLVRSVWASSSPPRAAWPEHRPPPDRRRQAGKMPAVHALAAGVADGCSRVGCGPRASRPPRLARRVCVETRRLAWGAMTQTADGRRGDVCGQRSHRSPRPNQVRWALPLPGARRCDGHGVAAPHTAG